MLINKNTTFGFLKPEIDVHILGLSTMANILEECGFKVCIAPAEIMKALEDIKKINNFSLVQKWIDDNNISIVSYSYRLDPQEGFEYFSSFMHQLKDFNMFRKDGGRIECVTFAGLPDTCKLISNYFGNEVVCFPGDETAIESLKKYQIPEQFYPKSFSFIHEYDKYLKEFAIRVIESEKYKDVPIPDHYGYKECGTSQDSFVRRLQYCKEKRSLPLIRVHAGPYSPNREESVKEFIDWSKQLAKGRFLDVLSIGSSQLTQQHFGESWEGLHNGGGVPINSEIEYKRIADAAKPMLVRTYAGTKNVPELARIHERSLNISWHALSFWWFCKLDGRGNNTVLENLREHIETIKYIASTGKPLEPNVPHHFSFRGGDDVTYIVSGFLAAKTAKKYGIKNLILQNMLNTPKYTWGIQDIAKGRAFLKLVRELEDVDFKVCLQCRAGLDYFSPDIETAKVQLATVTAMMDDIEPDNPESPEIIHVVSYSEAVRLATPPIIDESIKITLSALREYRTQKKLGLTYNTLHDIEIQERYNTLYENAKSAIQLLEKTFPDLYTPEGLFRVYDMGFLPTPYIFDPEHIFSNATKWRTVVANGGVKVVDENGKNIDTIQRYKDILGM